MSLPRTYSKRAVKRKAESEQQLDLPKKQKLGLEPQPLSTPPKLARDLSQIFDDATASLSSSSKNRNPPSPSKVAKRMLGRSKTESSINSEPSSPSSSKIADRTSSLPSLPSPNSKQPPSHSIPPSPEKSQPEAPATPKRTNSLKRTYAGRSRTFLVALPVDPSATSLEQTIQEEEDAYMNRESYDSLRTRYGIDNSEDDPYGLSESAVSSVNTTPTKGKGKGRTAKAKAGNDKPLPPADTMKPFQSITEIRNKGESRRFLDEVGYLLEGMDKDETPALRRSSAMEIANRLCETEFARKAKAAEFLLRTWEAFIEGRAGLGEDKVLDVIFAFFCALVARDSGSLSDLVERARLPTGSSTGRSGYSPFISTLFSLLAITTKANDLLHIISTSSIPDGQLKKLGVMKSDRILLKSLRESIMSNSQLLPAAHHISTAALITYALSSIPPLSLSPAHHLEPLLRCMRTYLTALIIEGYTEDGDAEEVSRHQSSNGHASVASFDDVSFGVLQDLLGLFDSYLLKRWSKSSEEEESDIIDRAREDWLAKGLVGLGVRAEAACCYVRNQPDERFIDLDDDESPVDLASATKCVELTLRVLVSLTHADPDWSSTVVHDSVAVTFIVGQVCRADDVRWRSWQKTHKGVQSRKGKAAVKQEPEERGMDVDLTDSDGDTKELLKSKNGRTKGYSQAQALDRLCLALGLFTNVVQEVAAAKAILREARFDSGCIHQLRPCIFSCTCPNSTSVLNTLANVYHHQLLPSQAPATGIQQVKRERSPSLPPRNGHSQGTFAVKAEVESAEAEADASFLLGHLSVLFGLLMMGNTPNQVAIIEALPSEATNSGSSNRKSSRRAKLDRLVENAVTLATFYEKISQAVDANGNVDDPEGEETAPGELRADSRLEDISRGVNVTQEVVSFLEELRDDR